MGWQDAPAIDAAPKWQAAPAVEPQESDRDVIGTTDDGGVFYKNADGSLGFTSSGYATNDQEIIAKMMEGMTPAQVGQQSIDEARIAENPVASRALKFVEGVPFVGSYADEAVNLFSSEAAENMRASSSAMDRENPRESAALGVAGAISGAVPIALAATPGIIGNGLTVGAKALRLAGLGAVAGAVEGAVSGYGRQEGGREDNAAGGALWGGLGGGVLGGAAPYVGEGIAKVLTRLKGSDLSVIASNLGISKAAAKVVKAALDAGDMRRAEDAMRRAGPNAMLADAGLPATQLLDAAANSGGAAGRITADAIEDRAALEAKGLTGSLDRFFGKPAGRASLSKAVREGTADARTAAYDAAYAQPIDYSGLRGQAIERVLKRVPQSAIDTANKLMALNGETSAQIIAKVAKDGSVTYERLPDVRQLDYITRALGDVAEKENASGKLGGATQLGKAYGDLSRQIRNLVKGEVPEYAKALDVASDAISRVNAGKAGYDMLRPGTTREMTIDALRGASKAEREEMKKGVRSYVDDTLANVAKTLTDPNTDAREAIKLLRDMSTRANQKKVRVLLGKDAAEAFFQEMDRAAVTFELRAALAQNSKTAIRQSIQGSVRQQASPRMLETLAGGEPVVAAKRFVQVFTGNTSEAQALREAGIYEEIATALTGIRGHQAQTALKLVNKAMSGQKLTEQQASFIGNIIAESGALAGSHEASKLLSTR